MVASIFIMEIDFSAIGNKKTKDVEVIVNEEIVQDDKEETSE